MVLLHEERTYKIIGACINVHKSLGNGFLESVYQEALEKEFVKQNIPLLKQHKLLVMFNGKPLDKYFKVDFLCFESIILEIKATSFLHNDFKKQTINYLNASGLEVGLLINFGESSLKWKRFINTKAR
ncbi:GxxExxY protein [Maribellus sp. YY47]|uniref:GxxExxY protein n=1 Tax=Maribellus sp. YY47 TaxID=2929486 RepID=UPI002000E726|nr:GxxExxY protein [Maribellus sp. YY47]MCK3685178.1 GxxExxY protein [Maribellus sp. YY47]